MGGGTLDPALLRSRGGGPVHLRGNLWVRGCVLEDADCLRRGGGGGRRFEPRGRPVTRGNEHAMPFPLSPRRYAADRCLLPGNLSLGTAGTATPRWCGAPPVRLGLLYSSEAHFPLRRRWGGQPSYFVWPGKTEGPVMIARYESSWCSDDRKPGRNARFSGADTVDCAE